MSPLEIEKMVKILQVMRLNMFGVEGVDHRVYAEITRFAHSCASNCQYTLRGMSIFCYARRDIKAGEELAISYNSPRDLDPTHERRLRYLEVKEFTCHCPRCDAFGDDTRQFDCFDPKCKGVMMVCQPLSQKEPRVTHVSYDGVAVIDPHLSPCTVCHRAPPADYQTEMLALEATLLDEGPRIVQRFSDMMDEHRHSEMEPLYQELLRMKIPSRHGASLPLLRVKWRVLHTLNHTNRTCYLTAVQEAMLEYVRALEGIFIYPGRNLLQELIIVVDHCSNICLESVFPPAHEKALCLKALRMHLLFNGRQFRDACLDKTMLKCHKKVSSERSTEMCAFCEGSPLHAALMLSRCSRCSGVSEGPLEAAQEGVQGKCGRKGTDLGFLSSFGLCLKLNAVVFCAELRRCVKNESVTKQR